jgi:dihydrofolate reductase
VKTIVYMASTPNGFIARADNDTNFISDDEWDLYQRHSLEARNLIVGRNTYFELTDEQLKELDKNLIVVVSSKNDFDLRQTKHVVAASPELALKAVEESGCEVAFVAGGAQLNGSFFAANLVDELYLDIEPQLIGDGVPLVSPQDIDVELELLDVNQFAPNEVQLHYLIKNR